MRYGDRAKHGGRRHIRGQAHKLAKLTDAQVQEVQRRRAAGEKLASLSAAFGVSESRISKISRRLW